MILYVFFFTQTDNHKQVIQTFLQLTRHFSAINQSGYNYSYLSSLPSRGGSFHSFCLSQSAVRNFRGKWIRASCHFEVFFFTMNPPQQQPSDGAGCSTVSAGQCRAYSSDLGLQHPWLCTGVECSWFQDPSALWTVGMLSLCLCGDGLDAHEAFMFFAFVSWPPPQRLEGHMHCELNFFLVFISQGD